MTKRHFLAYIFLTTCGFAQVDKVPRGRALGTNIEKAVARLSGATALTGPRGALRLAGGFRTAPYSGEPRDAATQFLKVHSDLLGDSGALRPDRASEVGGMHFIRFTETYRDIPVFGAEVVVSLTAANEVFQVSSSYANWTTVSGNWEIDAARAQSLALKSRNVKPRGVTTRERVWRSSGDAITAAWRILVPASEPFGDWEYLVDARTGAILDERDTLARAGNAYAYVRNPAIDGPTPKAVALPNLNDGKTLSGKYAVVKSDFFEFYNITPGSGPGQLATPDSSGNFPWLPPDPRFSEENLYFHMDRAHSQFVGMGLKGFDAPMNAMAYSPDAYKNGTPFYSASTNTIHFAPLGPRLIDAAWDGDVVLHEYAHGVIQFLVASQGTDFPPLSEGYADYFAASIQNDPKFGAYFAQSAGQRVPYIRALDNTFTYPRDIYVDPHHSGQILSGALWDIRTQAGATAADALALASLAGLTGAAGFCDAGQSAVNVANNVFGGSVATTVQTVMNNRGLTSQDGIIACSADILSPATTYQGSTISASNTSCSLDYPQGRVPVPAGVSTVSISMASQVPLYLLVRYRRPVTITNGQPDFDYATSASTQTAVTVGAGATPEPQAGVYYAAIINCYLGNVGYLIRADYTTGATFQQVNSGDSVSGSIPAGTVLNSRQFAIQVPAGTTGMTVSVQSSAATNVYVRKDQLVALSLEGLPVADAYKELSSGSDSLTLTAQSVPGLKPGLYYIAVYNTDSTQNASFTLSASLNSTAVSSTTVTPLVSGAATQTTVSAGLNGVGTLGSTQFSFAVPTAQASLALQATTTSTNGMVLVRKGSPVALNDAGALQYDYYFSCPQFTNYAIGTSSQPALQAGTYYFAFVNYATSAGSFNFTATLSGVAGGQPPTVNAGGVVNGASFQGSGVAPGSIVAVFGTNFGTLATAQAIPLPSQLSGTTVFVNGVAAPLFFVSPNQINMQLPFETPIGSVGTSVSALGGISSTSTINVVAVAPGILTQDATGTGAGLITDAFTGALITAANPIPRGGIVTVYASGYGPVSPPVASGTATTGLSSTLTPVTAKIGGVDATVTFAGLAPTFVALYQLNIQIPANAPTGVVTLNTTVNGVSSNPVTIAVK